MSAEYLTWRKAIRRFTDDLVAFQGHRSAGLDVDQAAAELGVSVEAARMFEDTIVRLMADVRQELVLYRPSGCRYCGIEERAHFQRWTETAHWHGWAAPLPEQRKARMLARRAVRLATKSEAAPDPARSTAAPQKAHNNNEGVNAP